MYLCTHWKYDSRPAGTNNHSIVSRDGQNLSFSIGESLEKFDFLKYSVSGTTIHQAHLFFHWIDSRNNLYNAELKLIRINAKYRKYSGWKWVGSTHQVVDPTHKNRVNGLQGPTLNFKMGQQGRNLLTQWVLWVDPLVILMIFYLIISFLHSFE